MTKFQREDLAIPPWAVVVGTFGYVGFFPVAPGTVASTVAAAMYYLLPLLQQNLILIAVSLPLMIAGIKAVDIILRTANEADPAFVVCDEVLGQWVALMTPIYQGNLLFVLVSFVFFRLFDITKPFPASHFQRKTGAFHIMMDDIVAGIYANLAAHLCLWLFSISGLQT